MLDFTYHSPTELIFGRRAQELIGARLAERVGAGPLLVIHGRGSAERSGVLAQVCDGCREAGFEVTARGGARPNPEIGFVAECVAAARESGARAILAVGGGSVIDTAKATAAAVAYEGDPWDFFSGRAEPRQCLPLAVVLTIPGAGSEMSRRCVISRGELKLGMGNDLIRPLLAAVDPSLFFTLSREQMATAAMDMISHILERYFTATPDVEFTSGQAEAALRVIMSSALRLRDALEDYAAWSELALAGSFAHCGFYGLGHEEDWGCHAIEHALSGLHSDVTHGRGLAVITPAWMRWVWPSGPGRFRRFAVRAMGVEDGGDEERVISLGIAKFAAFIQLMGLPARLSELGAATAIDSAAVAELATRSGPVGRFCRLDADAVRSILNSVS